MVIWITGLSASGKTTLSRAYEKKYKNKFPNLVLLDGDLIRDLYGNDLGFKKSDRILQIKRLQSIALFLEKQSIIVIVAALYSDHNLLEMNRKLFDDYFEIYLKADVAQLQKREFKDLYKNALNGRIKDAFLSVYIQMWELFICDNTNDDNVNRPPLDYYRDAVKKTKNETRNEDLMN